MKEDMVHERSTKTQQTQSKHPNVGFLLDLMLITQGTLDESQLPKQNQARRVFFFTA